MNSPGLDAAGFVRKITKRTARCNLLRNRFTMRGGHGTQTREQGFAGNVVHMRRLFEKITNMVKRTEGQIDQLGSYGDLPVAHRVEGALQFMRKGGERIKTKHGS